MMTDRQTVRNGHIILCACLSILLLSSEHKDSLYSRKSITINMLQEEPEMQELRLQIDGKHEGDCEKPGKTSKVG